MNIIKKVIIGAVICILAGMLLLPLVQNGVDIYDEQQAPRIISK